MATAFARFRRGLGWAPLTAAFAALLTAAALAQPAIPEDPGDRAHLEYLGSASIPNARVLDDGVFGGISGLTWDEAGGRFLAVSDAKETPRVYTLDIRPPDAPGGDARIAIKRVFILPSIQGAKSNPRDGEAVAPDGLGGFAVAFEEPASVARYDAAFRARRGLGLAPEALARRLAPNRAFESLGLVPGGGPLGETPALLAITEWGPEPSDGSASAAERLLARGRCAAVAFDPATLKVRSQGVYPLGLPITLRGGKSLSEIAPVGPDALLSLERSMAPGAFFSVQIFVTTIARSETGFTLAKYPVDVPAFPSLERLGNVEAMAIGPPLADSKGGRLLVLATDNNFADPATGRNATDFLLFRLTIEDVGNRRGL